MSAQNPRSPSDAEMVADVLGGNDDAFAPLVERYRDEFARYAASLCGDADLAADAMQEAFIRAFRSLASCREPARFKAWFFRILTNQCHNLRDRTVGHEPLDSVQSPSEDRADRDLTRGELEDAVNKALALLTPEQREAFLLKHVQGYSYGEMSQLLNTGVDALKMRVYRARDVVRQELGKWM